jgi:hypothetical protein
MAKENYVMLRWLIQFLSAYKTGTSLTFFRFYIPLGLVSLKAIYLVVVVFWEMRHAENLFNGHHFVINAAFYH